jgi:hypothetical protein
MSKSRRTRPVDARATCGWRTLAGVTIVGSALTAHFLLSDYPDFVDLGLVLMFVAGGLAGLLLESVLP